MKVHVWTSWDGESVDYEHGRPKCIFIGDISAIPREGESVTLRDGFGAETVRSVMYDFVNDEVEIHIRGIDRNNEYGKCLWENKS